MKCKLCIVTYDKVSNPIMASALLDFIGLERLLDENVAEIEIIAKLPSMIIDPQLKALYDWFESQLHDKPSFAYSKASQKLEITYTSKIDGINCYRLENASATFDAEDQLTKAAIFATLFDEISQLFIENAILLKRKYHFDCQLLTDEFVSKQKSLPKDDVLVDDLIHYAQLALRANSNDIEEPARYHQHPLPKSFKVNRREGGSSHIGHTTGGDQFWAQVVAQFEPFKETAPKGWEERKIWYAVLHTFESDGKHISTVAMRIGPSSDGEDEILLKAKAKMDDLISTLGQIEFGPIKIQLFEYIFDDFVFGLVDTSTEEEGDQVTMRPNDFVFSPPWNGDYDS